MTDRPERTEAARRRPRGAVARVLDTLLTTEPHQRVRLAMTCLAALLMLCCIGAVYLGVHAGLVDPAPVHWWALVCMGGLVGVYAAIRSGWSARLRDPALTLFQITSSMAGVATAYVIAGPMRGIVLPILAVILMFGLFGLTPRQMVGVLVYGLVLFGLAILYVQWHAGPGLMPVELALAYLVMIVVVLVSSTFLSLRTQAARTRLRRQKAELAHAMEQVRKLATHDELTGLPNRRSMLELLQAQARRAGRGSHPALLAQLDLDHFKDINDSHGHAAGDLALQAFAQAVRAGVRTADTLARWGGEEFVLLATDTTPAEGVRLLHRLHGAVAQLRVPLPSGAVVRVTVSIGAARWRPGETAEEVLHRADAAMYQAKRQGRDRITWAPGDAPR